MEDFRKYEPFFGSWKIVKKIGEGAFGKVFEVERSDFGKNFKSALKVVSIPSNQSEIESLTSEGMDDESVKKYFNSMAGEMINEFELLAKLQGNSYIVSYDDHMIKEHENGIGYDIIIRMELLTPISTKLTAGEMPQEDVLQMGIDICRALEVCEKFHIIHRDIKPENIFLSEIGTYKLGDFGVARTMENDNHVLSRKGTQSYMAPELYKEEIANETADIYSLGIVLYRLCNKNRLPFMPPFPKEVTFTDREVAMRKRIMGDPMPKPSEAIDPFAAIILKACAYRIQDRYQNARQMRKELEALQRCLNGEEVSMPAPTKGPGMNMESSYSNMSFRGPQPGMYGPAGNRNYNPSMRPGGPMGPGMPMPNRSYNPSMSQGAPRPGLAAPNGSRGMGPMMNGPRPMGPMPNGPRGVGPMPNGPRPMGPMPNGPRGVGPMPNGPRPMGPMPNGPRPMGPMPNGPRGVGPMPNGPRPMGPMPNGPRGVGPMPNGPRPMGPMPNGPMNGYGGPVMNGMNPRNGQGNALPPNGSGGPVKK